MTAPLAAAARAAAAMHNDSSQQTEKCRSREAWKGWQRDKGHRSTIIFISLFFVLSLSLSPSLSVSKCSVTRSLQPVACNPSHQHAISMSSTCLQVTSNINHNSQGYDTQGPRKRFASFPLGDFFYPLDGRFQMKGISIYPHIGIVQEGKYWDFPKHNNP